MRTFKGSVCSWRDVNELRKIFNKLWLEEQQHTSYCVTVFVCGGPRHLSGFKQGSGTFIYPLMETVCIDTSLTLINTVITCLGSCYRTTSSSSSLSATVRPEFTVLCPADLLDFKHKHDDYIFIDSVWPPLLMMSSTQNKRPQNHLEVRDQHGSELPWESSCFWVSFSITVIRWHLSVHMWVHCKLQLLTVNSATNKTHNYRIKPPKYLNLSLHQVYYMQSWD